MFTFIFDIFISSTTTLRESKPHHSKNHHWILVVYQGSLFHGLIILPIKLCSFSSPYIHYMPYYRALFSSLITKKPRRNHRLPLFSEPLTGGECGARYPSLWIPLVFPGRKRRQTPHQQKTDMDRIWTVGPFFLGGYLSSNLPKLVESLVLAGP